MAVTMNQVLAEIDKDEPDYAAAAKLGPDALPHLQQIVEADDPMRASKAAYLAGLIGGVQAAVVLEKAAAHRDPIVRVATAHALRTGIAAPSDVLARLLDDGDIGVRKVALRAAKRSDASQLRSKVSKMAESDPDEFIRDVAKEVVKGFK